MWVWHEQDTTASHFHTQAYSKAFLCTYNYIDFSLYTAHITRVYYGDKQGWLIAHSLSSPKNINSLILSHFANRDCLFAILATVEDPYFRIEVFCGLEILEYNLHF